MQVALRKESVDRNKCSMIIVVQNVMSLSARRAWIEIIDDLLPSTTRRVALRKESVDRNDARWIASLTVDVALRKESVDRNKKMFDAIMQGDVALRKESVDRNNTPTAWYRASDTSLSARRAWIEIWF